MATDALRQGGTSYDDHQQQSRRAQRRADLWLMSGTVLIGAAILGLIGLPLFLRGVYLQVQAQRSGLSVRPTMVTLVGYLVALDAALNSLGCRWT